MENNWMPMDCKICKSKMTKAFLEKVLGKYEVSYFKCKACGFLCTETPFWLSEAYNNSITNEDTGILARNIDYSRKISVVIYYLFNPNGIYLDYAGGYGIFTRLMRDVGFEFFHTDSYTINIFAKEFEWDKKVVVDGITCFECFEHLGDPLATIEDLSKIAKTIFFSTVLLPEAIPPPSWDYYGFNHGQHVAFFSAQTLRYVAQHLGLHLASIGNLHLFSEDPVDSKQLQILTKKANRAPFLSSKTTFEVVAKKMRSKKMV